MRTVTTFAVGFSALSAMTIGVSQAALIAGQTIGVDFGNGNNTTGSGSEPNFVVLSTTSVTGASTTDTTGGSTGGVLVDLTMAGTNNEFGYITGTSTGDRNVGFGSPLSAGNGNYGSYGITSLTYNDGAFSRGGPITVTFRGLDNALTYDLVGFVNGGNTRTNATQVAMTVGTSTVSKSGAQTSGGSQSGTLSPSELKGMRTDGSGNLTVRFTASTYFGVGGLTLTAIPEPGAAMLSALGLLVLLRRRR